MNAPAKAKVGRVIPNAPWLDDGGSQRGGLGKAHQLFGERLTRLLNELNEVLPA